MDERKVEPITSYADTAVVFACDLKYFPFAKGLILSALATGALRDGVILTCIDLGCSPQQLEWLHAHGVSTLNVNDQPGLPFDPSLGYRRAQLCRPFLPQLIPHQTILIWIDADFWIQDSGFFTAIAEIARVGRGRIALCPESHPSYSQFSEVPNPVRRTELFRYYEPVFGSDIASQMADKVVLNTGLFAMTRDSSLWGRWAECLMDVEESSNRIDATAVRRTAKHFIDQTSLNVLLADSEEFIRVDPLYNYICLLGSPFVDNTGRVRTGRDPFTTIAGVHLAGGFYWHRRYLMRGLFYERGEYLTDEDISTLFGREAQLG